MIEFVRGLGTTGNLNTFCDSEETRLANMAGPMTGETTEVPKPPRFFLGRSATRTAAVVTPVMFRCRNQKHVPRGFKTDAGLNRRKGGPLLAYLSRLCRSSVRKSERLSRGQRANRIRSDLKVTRLGSLIRKLSLAHKGPLKYRGFCVRLPPLTGS